MKKNKLNIRNIYRPDWLKNKERSKKKLWLDKNENTDENLSRYIKKIKSSESFLECKRFFSAYW